jgi:phytoene desaturase
VLYSTLGTEGLSFAEKVRQKMVKPSTALYMLYFKTRRPYHRVAPHTVVLSQRWEGLVRDICKGRKLPKDPILNLYRPGANDPSLRARDGDLFTVVAPVPHLGNYDGWKFDATRFKDTVLSILEDRVLPGLPAALVFAEAVDPRYFRDVLMSPLGAGISAGSLSPQSTWFQFPNCMEKVRNLYVCGAAPPPGGGLAGVVASAKLIERSVRRDFPSVQEYQSPLSEIAARSVA